MKEKAQAVIEEVQRIEQELQSPEIYNDPEKFIVLSQQQKAMQSKYDLAREFLKLEKLKTESEMVLRTEKDLEILEIARADLEQAKKNIPAVAEKLKKALIPRDQRDQNNAIVEIRPGTGGDESSLFAEEMMRAEMKFAESEGFKTEILSETYNASGGIKEVIFKIIGFGAYAKFKFEGGVHRVQRIPVTESQGRVHTSAISIVVMPEVAEKDFAIKMSDLRVDVYRASGHGGQSVNTTDSAVRLTHLPTGVVVTCQDEKSQLKNKNKAFSVLRSRLVAREEEKKQKNLGSLRLVQIGSGDRSDKIRTYNFPQDRVTDHRIGQNFSNLPGIMNGELSKLVEALSLAEEERLVSKSS